VKSLSLNNCGFPVLSDRPGEALLIADALQPLKGFVDSRANPGAGVERRGKVLHPLDHADRLVVHGTFRVAPIVGHPIEHGS
jgi:hypothetical protein